MANTSENPTRAPSSTWGGVPPLYHAKTPILHLQIKNGVFTPITRKHCMKSLSLCLCKQLLRRVGDALPTPNSNHNGRKTDFENW